MRTIVVQHPLVAHKLTTLRDETTDSATFRLLVEELVTLLAYEATHQLRTTPVTIQTPVAETTGVHLARPRPLVVPILRAGLGMLEGMMRLMPTAEVGFLGMVRDEDSLIASTYADRIPHDLDGRQVFALDPMLATGGTLVTAIDLLLDRGMMGDGVIDIPRIRGLVEAAGYESWHEVEIFSAETWWKRDPAEVLRICVERHATVC